MTDDKDQCPGTPAGATVNSIGCWALTNQVLFDYDKSNIKPEAHPFLEEVITILKANPNMAVVLQGHTDNKGSLKYNMGLSLRRANSVKEYLVNHGIAASRLETEGFAFKKPVALNGTAAGRALNRRVELHPK
ncbi:MAG: OmpA family protein [Desulfobacteraceae bacterium]|nr:MAG: OmpA family protein [Desulfobacteraceae bacterium]